jgi:membrane protein YdbS with pleckstrin-like domain
MSARVDRLEIVERVPAWLLILAAVVFAGLVIWTATDENWSGLIVSVVLLALSIVGLLRRPRPS